MIASRLLAPILLTASAIAAVIPSVAEVAIELDRSSSFVARVVVLDLLNSESQTILCGEGLESPEGDEDNEIIIVEVMADQSSNESQPQSTFGSHPLEAGHGPRVTVPDADKDKAGVAETKQQVIKVKAQPFGSHPLEYGHGPRQPVHKIPAGSYGDKKTKHQEPDGHHKQTSHMNDLKKRSFGDHPLEFGHGPVSKTSSSGEANS